MKTIPDREIKFRAWDKDHGMGMFYPVEWVFADVTKAKHPAGKTIEVIPMQYTGQKDKNGTKVYEGDVVTCDTWPEEDNKAVVEWYAMHAQFLVETPTKAGSMMFEPHVDTHFEVLGNIYENPDLLKESK